MNDNTISSAEIFAALLRDWKKSPLVGIKTHGKHSLQTPFQLRNGDMLWLVSEDYRVGNSHLLVPLQPEYPVTEPSSDDLSRYEQVRLRHLANPELDPQLKKAVEVAEDIFKEK